MRLIILIVTVFGNPHVRHIRRERNSYSVQRCDCCLYLGYVQLTFAVNDPVIPVRIPFGCFDVDFQRHLNRGDHVQFRVCRERVIIIFDSQIGIRVIFIFQVYCHFYRVTLGGCRSKVIRGYNNPSHFLLPHDIGFRRYFVREMTSVIYRGKRASFVTIDLCNIVVSGEGYSVGDITESKPRKCLTQVFLCL